LSDTIRSSDASPEAKALVADIADVLKPEQLWAIAERHLKAAFERGRIASYIHGEWTDLGATVDLRQLQEDALTWEKQNFGDVPSWHALLGVQEEVGELAHAHLKGVEGIRLTPEQVREKKIDAIGDIVVFLGLYAALEGIDMNSAVRDTWANARQRRWDGNKFGGKVGLVSGE